MALTDEDRNWFTTMVTALIRQSEERSDAKLVAAERRIKEELKDAIEATENRLLTEFHKWASPLDPRMRTHTAAIRALDLENEALSDRISKLEPAPITARSACPLATRCRRSGSILRRHRRGRREWTDPYVCLHYPCLRLG